MTHVFVSYKRDDEVRALRLVQALERQGLVVWWDRDLPGGESWRSGIEQALEDAGCVVVLWSKSSVGPGGEFVRDEAGHARQRGRLVPVLLDKVAPPLGFGEHQAIDLSRWHGNTRDPFFRDVIGAVRAKLDGRPAPAAIGPRARLKRRLLTGSGASIALVLFSAFGTNVMQLQDRACAVSGISDACGALGLGHRPSRAERLAWEARPAGSCPALRQHLERFPDGAYRERAAALLQGLRPDTATVATPFTRVIDWYVRTGTQPFPTRASAENDARERARLEAGTSVAACAARDGLERFRAAVVDQERFDCRLDRRGGWSCALDCRLTCTLERREVSERCGGE